MVRLKNRYLVSEMVYNDGLQRPTTSDQVYRAVRDMVKELHGSYGIACVQDSLMVKYLNPDTNMMVIRARRDFINEVHLAVTCTTKVGDHGCVLHTLYCGGTIRSCEKFLKKRTLRDLPWLLWKQRKAMAKKKRKCEQPETEKTEMEVDVPSVSKESSAHDVTQSTDPSKIQGKDPS